MARDVGQSPQLLNTGRLSIVHTVGDFFVTSAMVEEGTRVLQVRSFTSPESIVLSIRDPFGVGNVSGDLDAVSALPAFLNFPVNRDWLWRHDGTGHYQLVDARWLFEGGYDYSYQAPGRPAFHEPSNTVLIGIQRSGHFVLCDPDSGGRHGVLDLAQRRGDPDPVFDSKGRIWTIDYDTLVKIEADLTVSGQVVVQPGTMHDSRPMSRFAGELALSKDEKQVFVTRPFAGDIAVFDAGTLRLLDRLQIGGEPLFIGFMLDGLVTLEWRTSEYRFTPHN